MLNLFDEDFDAMDLVEGALALNKAINPETKVDWALAELQRLYHQAELSFQLMNQIQSSALPIFDVFIINGALLAIKKPIFHSRNGFIDKVLERRQGIPVSLGAVAALFC
ncbi:transglutaminase family protein [Vibrio metschnikovii]